MFNPKLNSTNLKEFNLDHYIDLVTDLSKIDRNIIDDELGRLPTYYSYYYGMLVKSKKYLDDAKFELEAYISAKKTDVRKDPTTNGLKKSTSDSIDCFVNALPEVSELNKLVSKYEEIYGLMKGICLTLDHKKDMLVQLSANRRQETKLYN